MSCEEILQLNKKINDLEHDYQARGEKIEKVKDKLYCWGETLDPQFQKEMLDILEV